MRSNRCHRGTGLLLAILVSKSNPALSFFRPSAFQSTRYCDRRVSALTVIRGGSEEVNVNPSLGLEGNEDPKTEEVFQDAEQGEDQQQQAEQVEEQVFVEAVADDPTLEEENSSAYVDRMEYADDEGEDATPGGFEVENREQHSEQKNEEAPPSEQQLESKPVDELPETAEAGLTSPDAPDTGAPKDDDTDAEQDTPSPATGEEVPEIETHTPVFEVNDVAAEPGSDVASEGNTSESMSSAAEITNDMKRALIKELNYSRKEVALMKPDIAAVVLEKRLRRPAEGMPDNWYLPGSTARSQSIVSKVLPKIIVPVAVGTLAVIAGKNMDVGSLFAFASKPVASKVPAYVIPPSPAVEQEETASTEEEEPPVIHANEQINALDEPHPRSIKPGQSSTTDELDVTWLDKAITAIERKIKALLRMEL